MNSCRSLTKLWAGLVVIGAGVFLLHQLNVPADRRVLPSVLREAIWFGPVAIASGGLLFFRAFAWGERLLTRRFVRSAGIGLFVAGLASAGIFQFADLRGVGATSGLRVIFSVLAVSAPGLALVLAAFFIPARGEFLKTESEN